MHHSISIVCTIIIKLFYLQYLITHNQWLCNAKNSNSTISSSNGNNNNIIFPTVEEAIELNRLSNIVYSTSRKSTCDDIVTSDALADDVTCHFNIWTRIGTEAIIVSSPSLSSSNNTTNNNDDDDGYIAVAFSGTDEKRDIYIDAHVELVPFGTNNTNYHTNDTSILVHSGFNHALFYDDLPIKLLNHVTHLRKQYPSYKLYVTGHSLGAALSQLFTLYLSEYLPQDIIINNLNYGCPKVGNKEWAHVMNRRKQISSWRYVHNKDIVPRLMVSPKFYHAGHNFQFDKDFARVFYYHYGDDELGYSGVPDDWYIRFDEAHNMTQALENHYLEHYHAYLVNKSSVDPIRYYPSWFMPLKNSSNQDNNDKTIITSASSSVERHYLGCTNFIATLLFGLIIIS